MKLAVDMTDEELIEWLKEIFPGLRAKYEAPPVRYKTKEELEHEHGWKLWYADQAEAQEYYREQRMLGKR